ncbi:MAG: UvrD-helicase domain-containing protein [Planctomycetota bacterium]|jgi:superfamily I DNA/RNA helicase|nr:UvrD-helicase domain-containing protein [Planctomycetota bacterium]
MRLNPQQCEAVRHQAGPLLILAGAGTGKTRVITERMAHMLRSGVPAEHILGVTFTNKAAAEMRARLAGLTGKRGGLNDLLICTFHSLAVRLLRRDAGLLGYTPGFSICDYGDQLALVRKAAATVRGGASIKPEDALRRIGSLKNRGVTPEEFRRQAIEEDEMVLVALYRRYQEAMKRQNCFDFDDLLLQAMLLFRDHPESLRYWRSRFRHIMVDEFQDTNQTQFDLVKLLAAPLDNICVVGDDDQSIYAWRGALAGNILKFAHSFPTAKSIALEQNYRSTACILSAANAVIRNNSGRREKNLWSDLGEGSRIRVVPRNDQFEEAEAIAREIHERRSAYDGAKPPAWGDFAVIIRANAQSRPLEDEFLAAKIPYQVIGGQSLFDRKEARDVAAFLAAVANPDGDSQLLRIINVPPRGIGGKTVDALTAHVIRHGGRLSGVLANPDRVDGLTAAAKEACRKFSALIDSWRKRVEAGAFSDLVRRILDETGYQEELAGLYPDPLDAASRWNEALEVGDSLAGYAERNPGATHLETLSEYLCEAMLAGRQDDDGRKGRDADAVRIITAHSAKGLEYPCVFIPGLEEEIFPHKNAIEADTVEEERPLFYVAMTRARRELTLSWNRKRVLRGKEHARQPSRFLAEIPGDLTEKCASPTREEENLEWIARMRSRLGKQPG